MKSFLRTEKFKSAVALALGCLGAALIVECGARIFAGSSTVLFPRFHAEAQYGKYKIRKLRANTTFWHTSVDGEWKFVTNSKGYRADREYEYAKPPGVYRVICVGDSHTQGFECRQDRTYASIIENYLQVRGVNAEVINAGVSGFSNAEALIYVENEGVRFNPDAVVLVFFANDLDDNLKSGLFGIENGEIVEKKHEHLPGVKVLDTINSVGLLRWLSQHSYAYSLVFNTVWEAKKRLLLSDSERLLTTEVAVKDDGVESDVQHYKNELTYMLLQRMKQFCEARDIKFIILDIPQFSRGDNFFSGSLPPELKAKMEQQGAEIISKEIFQEFEGTTEFFVRHGQKHISELTHLLFGSKCGRVLRDFQTGQISLHYMRQSPDFTDTIVNEPHSSDGATAIGKQL